MSPAEPGHSGEGPLQTRFAPPIPTIRTILLVREVGIPGRTPSSGRAPARHRETCANGARIFCAGVAGRQKNANSLSSALLHIELMRGVPDFHCVHGTRYTTSVLHWR